MNSETDLCAACGMCCDGTLFAHGVLEPGEPEPAGARVAWEEDARCFAQPCPQYNGGCAIYADRPTACRAFRCGVLEDLAGGVLDAASARARIAEVKAVVDDLAQALGVRDGAYSAAKEVLVRQADAEDVKAFAATHGQTLLKIAAFSAISKKYMLRDRAQGKSTEGAEDGGS